MIFYFLNKMERLNKEYKIDISPNGNFIYGSTNRKNPQVIYLVGKFWIQPTEKTNCDYELFFNDIKRHFKQQIKHILFNSKKFQSDFLFYLDINIDSITLTKKIF